MSVKQPELKVMAFQASGVSKVDFPADREGVKCSKMVRRLLLAGIANYKAVK